MNIDWTVKLGDILTILGFAAGGVTVLILIRLEVAKVRWDESSIPKRLQEIEAEMKALAAATVKLAVQDERLNSHTRRLDALEEDVRHLERMDHSGAMR